MKYEKDGNIRCPVVHCLIRLVPIQFCASSWGIHLTLSILSIWEGAASCSEIDNYSKLILHCHHMIPLADLMLRKLSPCFETVFMFMCIWHSVAYGLPHHTVGCSSCHKQSLFIIKWHTSMTRLLIHA